MRGRQGKKDGWVGAMRWMGLGGVALGLGLAAPGMTLAQWTGGTGTTPIYDADSNSKVGIGTSSPANDLHVKGQIGQGGRIEIQAGGSNKEAALQFFDPNEVRWGISSRNAVEAPNNRLGFFDNVNGVVTERLTILQGGGVGIGTTTLPSGIKLAVLGSVNVNNGTANVNTKIDDNKVRFTRSSDGSDASHVWYNSSGNRMELRAWGGSDSLWLGDGYSASTLALQNGRVGIGTATPANDLHVKGQSEQGGRIEIQTGSSNSTKEAALQFFDATELRWGISSRNAVESPNNRLGFFDNVNSVVTERMTLFQGGGVGIGTTTLPSGIKLAVLGSVNVNNGTANVNTKIDDNKVRFTRSSDGSDASHVLYNGSGNRMELRALGSSASVWLGDGASASTLALQNGRAGIGITAPSYKLHVGPGDAGLRVEGPGGAGTQASFGGYGDFAVDAPGIVGGRLVVKHGGNVGIGVANPLSKLAVDGTIKAKDVTVTNTPWADHVFAEGYELMPLVDVGLYIERNGRLPGVPSAAEVAEKGVSLGQTQAKLLEKVEELTLHAIELGRQNEKLRQDNEKLRLELEQRTARLEERLARLEHN